MAGKPFPLWHPHQKLWNWELAARVARLPIGGLLGRWLVHADSLILAVHVIATRLHRLGLHSLRRFPPDPSRQVLYVDCGVHKEGREIRLMSEWIGGKVGLRTIGFEASPRNYPEAVSSLADIPNLDLRQVALVGPEWTEPTIKLFRKGNDGRGDSIYPERGKQYDEVSVARLSEVLPPSGTVLVRMNIEGAELDVLQDLVDTGTVDRVSAFYGMWDDLSKIDWQRDIVFRQLLRRHRVRTITFNDRDLAHPLRRWAIRQRRFDIQQVRPPAVGRPLRWSGVRPRA